MPRDLAYEPALLEEFGRRSQQFGAALREARLAKSWARPALAREIIKRNGHRVWPGLEGMIKRLEDGSKTFPLRGRTTEDAAIRCFEAICQVLKHDPEAFLWLLDDDQVRQAGPQYRDLIPQLASRRKQGLGIPGQLLSNQASAGPRKVSGWADQFPPDRVYAKLAGWEELPLAAPFGLTTLDELCGGGLHRRTLTVIAGRPRMGLTTFALHVAASAVASGATCDFLSIEGHPVRALHQLFIEQFHAVWPGGLSGRESLPFHPHSMSWDIAAEFDPKGTVVIIDGHHPAGGNQGSRNIGTVLRACRRLTENGAAVLLTCELGRGVEYREEKRPLITDLPSTLAVAADVALLLFRPEYYAHGPNDAWRLYADIQVVRNRFGAVQAVGVDFNNRMRTFRDRGTSAMKWDRPS